MAQAFSIGRDASVQITASGAPLSPLTITKFTFKQDDIKLKSRPLNSPPVNQKVPDGWSGSFDYDRGNSALDNYFVQEEGNFWAGQNFVNITVILTIKDANTGAISQYRWDNVVLTYSDGGNFAADEKVSQKVDWVASTMTQVL